MTRLHEWTLSGIPLVTASRPKSGFWFETWAQVDLGEPEARFEERRSLLTSGADEIITGYGNRSQTFTTEVCGYTAEDVHQGERALAMVLGGPGVLEWLPPRSGPRTLFDVRTSTMRLAFDDLEFARDGVIRQPYTFSLRSAPEAYSEFEVEEKFAPASSTATSVSDGSSATNWPGLTAGTYLTQSVVTTPWVEPTAYTSVPRYGDSFGHPVTSLVHAIAVLPYSPTLVTSNLYLFAEIAFEGEGAGMGTPRLVGASPDTPVAVVPQTNGFTRYYFAMPASKKVRLEVPVGGGNASRGRVHLNQLSTSTGVPGSSVFVVRTQGAVSVPARLRLYQTTGENLLYADPTMLTHGWAPDLGSTWQNAPEGTYYLYIYPTGSYSSGDVFSLWLTGQPRTARTRVKWASTSPRWFPIGPFTFGGRRSQKIGATTGGIAPDDGLTYPDGLDTTMEFRKNGGDPTVECAVRLIREAPEAKLLHVRGSDQRLFVDPPSFDRPRPGVFTSTAADPSGLSATTLLPTTDSWAWPEIGPPVTPLWYQRTNSGTHSMPNGFEMAVKHRPAGHTLAPVVVQQTVTVGDPSNLGED